VKYNYVTDSSGIVQDINFLAGSSNDTYKIADKTRNVNEHLREVAFHIWKNAADWDFDDSNQTDAPCATTTLVDEQQDYSLPTTALDIRRVEVMNSSGNYEIVAPFDESQITETALSEYYETSGMPIYYRLQGQSIFLYPKPSASLVTVADGLKIYTSREVHPFTITDTSAVPGFHEDFHRVLSYGAALDYVIAKQITDKVTYLTREHAKYMDMIATWASKRHKGFKTRRFIVRNESMV
jgi:hypothetical protein